MRLKPSVARADDMATRTESVTRTFVISMLQRRLNDGKDPEDAQRKGKLDAAGLKKRMSGGFGADWFELENLVEGLQVEVHSDKTHWREELMNAEREVRRAIERGFDAKELDAAYVKFDQMPVPRPRVAKQHRWSSSKNC